jgi:deoxyribonuclease V
MKWPGSIAEAREEQERLSMRVKIVPYRGEPHYVAGVDAAFSDDTVFAAACLFLYPQMALVEQTGAERKLEFPYVPGFLSFREAPAIIAAVEQLSRTPDIILVDGQGLAHPRGIGIASHLGVLLDIPTIGCAKTRLVGEYREPEKRKGSRSTLMYEGKKVGAVLRTRDGVRPLFISPGHRCDIESSVRIILFCVEEYRIPGPLRCADSLSKKFKKENLNREVAKIAKQ